MIPVWLGIVIILAFTFIAILYMKGVLIWRDVMLERNNRIKKEIQNLKQHESRINSTIKSSNDLH